MLISFGFVAVICAIFIAAWISVWPQLRLKVRGDAVLLVFAHPDDEAMFFSPLLEYLRRINVRVHFLCLCNGDFNGLGTIREKELVQSAAHYGVRHENVKIVSDRRLQDGMKNVWDAEVVAAAVKEHLVLHPAIRCVVTFDEYGVSSHPNHMDTFRGVRLLSSKLINRSDDADDALKGVRFLKLKTNSLLVKYSGVVSLLRVLVDCAGHVERQLTVVVKPSLQQVLSSLRGMQCHPSQLVWFRYLFVWFSSYTYCNELQEI